MKGQNLIVKHLSTGGRAERVRALAGELSSEMSRGMRASDVGARRAVDLTSCAVKGQWNIRAGCSTSI